jgi:phosphoenolpyruvate carboxykinase (diphosphate)
MTMNLDPHLALGFRPTEDPDEIARERIELLRYINLKLAAYGLPIAERGEGEELVGLAAGLLANFREKTRRLESIQRCPADHRIEAYLNRHFADLHLDDPMRLPGRTFILDRHGMARELSLPADGDTYESELVQSFRVRNGVLHNPRADRRTTQGTFHVVEGGLPIPGDKRAVPRQVFVNLFRHAVQPPNDQLRLPFTAGQAREATSWVSLLLRPLVCPEVTAVNPYRTMEVRFFAPGTLVSNLDFVESIFGNAGDPFIPENDAGLDVGHWTGHTGCVILAPHLVKLTKQELGLPHVSEASERQIADRMCWEDEAELYNDGTAFKITCRTDEGVIVTLIADNYFGYCKKEVKTQISYAANLLGGAEEEHAGGALVFPSWSLGEEFQFDSQRYNGATFADVEREYGSLMEVQPTGFGIDRKFPNVIYIPEDARASLREQNIRWERDGQSHEIPLLPDRVYMAPSGYRLRMEKHPSAPSWRLIGSGGEPVFCHKPCTVSGGGKSEISKSLIDYMEYGTIFVADYERDMQQVRQIFERDYSTRWKPEAVPKHYQHSPSRPILSPQRSLGSVIKLLNPADEYNDDYNAWLESIPSYVMAMVFIIKRFHRPEWGDDWARHFTVDDVNGSPGHELKLNHRKLVGTYLRVGYGEQQQWRLFKVRQDFSAAFKIQTEDDITASTVVPGRLIEGIPESLRAEAYKFAVNCEYRLFQRPDEAIIRGFDKQAEADLAREDLNFISNFEPLPREKVHEMLTKVVDFDAFTEPMKRLLRSVDEGKSRYIVCSDNPRQVDGKPTKNPRYLQDRPDMVNPRDRYVAEMGTRLFRRIPAGKPVPLPVNSILSGRRNNPPEPEKGIRSLAVYNPLHYQELPELFMDYICSLTGKSPSTTGAGSEGALTKGPFNALRTTADLNTALVSMILTGIPGFSTAAGHVGPHCRFDHDISLLIPEVWCRLTPRERDPNFLIEQGHLEKLEDMPLEDGSFVPVRRLGYRITRRFVRTFFGRVFDNPVSVFDERILEPDLQDRDAFLDGVQYIMEAYQRVAKRYFEDGSVEEACPPLKALLHIMAYGEYDGADERDREIREMFTREALLQSDWYHDRLKTKQIRDVSLWRRQHQTVANYLETQVSLDEEFRRKLEERREYAAGMIDHVSRSAYVDELIGTLGADPLGPAG